MSAVGRVTERVTGRLPAIVERIPGSGPAGQVVVGARVGPGGCGVEEDRCGRPSSPATGSSSTRPSGDWPRRGTIVVFREPGTELLASSGSRRRTRRTSSGRATGPIRLTVDRRGLAARRRPGAVPRLALLRSGGPGPAPRPSLVPLRSRREDGPPHASLRRVGRFDPRRSGSIAAGSAGRVIRPIRAA